MYDATSNSASISSGRVSYLRGFTGPSLSLDSACSASLVATHIAGTTLFLAECSRACIVGTGILEASSHAAFAAAGMLSG